MFCPSPESLSSWGAQPTALSYAPVPQVQFLCPAQFSFLRPRVLPWQLTVGGRPWRNPHYSWFYITLTPSCPRKQHGMARSAYQDLISASHGPDSCQGLASHWPDFSMYHTTTG